MMLALLLFTQVSPELDLNVSLPTQKQPNLKVMLQSRSNPNLRYSLANEPGPKDCFPRLERVTATDTVISCTGEKSDIHPNLKFIYDIRAKSLVARVSYMPFALYGDSLTATNGERSIRVIVNPGPEPAFRIETSHADPVRRIPPQFKPNPELPPLRQSTYDDFARARPERVSNGYDRKSTTLEEIVGPRVKSDNLLWFGKSFYDGEGHTGIGGFGFYDYTARRYTTYSPPEIVPYSVSAIAVSPQHVWFGLASNGEWGSTGAGILRFDRATQQVFRFESPDIPNAFRIDGNRIIAATNFGITIIEGDRQRRFFVDQTSDGRLRVAEAVRCLDRTTARGTTSAPTG